ncbi:hypothetical protein Srot_0459 [Segniliparus rotundus DSM 44985]|uniref:Lipoprotein n=1 Tax=Segniliparus rotundus (strain ATCC BAA-972 / CDC 1076 / CIP 108378 / DSM 44985 / JCM 13578) TaxID=640132 RepID=D6ZBW9_SEGRD|nr:hypothetical protein [Segniliparus rotundus]ADG96946.1 hypothetical protein Srot_0459 [Segniliparus rotundus DSM 44985]
MSGIARASSITGSALLAACAAVLALGGLAEPSPVPVPPVPPAGVGEPAGPAPKGTVPVLQGNAQSDSDDDDDDANPPESSAPTVQPQS